MKNILFDWHIKAIFRVKLLGKLMGGQSAFSLYEYYFVSFK